MPAIMQRLGKVGADGGLAATTLRIQNGDNAHVSASLVFSLKHSSPPNRLSADTKQLCNLAQRALLLISHADYFSFLIWG